MKITEDRQMLGHALAIVADYPPTRGEGAAPFGYRAGRDAAAISRLAGTR